MGNENLIVSFLEFSYCFVLYVQLVLVCKFSDGFFLQLSFGYIYCNFVFFEDENGMFSVSVGVCLQVICSFGLLGDVVFLLVELCGVDSGYKLVIGFGFEFEISGYVFQVNLMNVIVLMEIDFIFYIIIDWIEGEFCLGFMIFCWFNF